MSKPIQDVYRDKLLTCKEGKSYRELQAIAEQGGYKINHSTLYRIGSGQRGSGINLKTVEIIDYLYKILIGDQKDEH